MRQATLCGCKSGKPIIGEKQAIYINTTKKGGLLRQFSFIRFQFQLVNHCLNEWVFFYHQIQIRLGFETE